ncbi:MAG TPA: hypothetical protein DIU15_09835, partial [Deltaproteobacteria bacterium]|nr:hypothetical protein [Deltaproteobacteria bacterium]
MVVLVSLAAAWAARGVRFDMSIDVWFLEDDPDLVSYHRFLETFDSDQIVVLAWEDPGLWTEEGLAFLHRFTERLESISFDPPADEGLPSFGVQRARSITSVSEVLAQPGSLTVSRLYDPDEPPDPLELKERVMSSEQLRGALVSEDGRVCSVLLVVDHLTDQAHLKIELAAAIREVVAELAPLRSVQVATAGPTFLDDAFFRYTERDIATIFPLMFVVIVLAMLMLFRSVWALPLPLAVVLLTCLWVTGGMGLFGMGMTIIHSAVYPMLLGVAIACSIHVITRTLLLRAKGLEPEPASKEALRQMLAPCFYTMATTIAGLLSLCSADLLPVRQMGVLGAVGVAFAFVLTFALGPWLLPLLPAPSGGAEGQTTALHRWWKLLDKALVALASMVQRRAVVVALASFVLLLVALVGLRDLSVGSNPMNYFKKAESVRTDVLYVDEHLAGASSLEVFIDTGEPDRLKSPE